MRKFHIVLLSVLVVSTFVFFKYFNKPEFKLEECAPLKSTPKVLHLSFGNGKHHKLLSFNSVHKNIHYHQTNNIAGKAVFDYEKIEHVDLKQLDGPRDGFTGTLTLAFQNSEIEFGLIDASCWKLIQEFIQTENFAEQ